MPVRPARFSTHELTDEQRCARWEDWNRDALVGLTCHTPHGRGLRGEEVTLELGGLTLGHVQADVHHISRSTATVVDNPARSMVVYAVLHGRTTFRDRIGSQVVPAGGALLVDADDPFERTFPTRFAELAIKVPWQQVHERPGPDRRGAARVVATDGLTGLRARALGRQLVRSHRTLDPVEVAVLERVARDVVESLTVGDGTGDRLALARLLIDQHLADPTLSASRLATVLRMSERQLSRLFADAGTTVPKELTERRLRLAETLLAQEVGLPVAEIAARCGYTSAAYFSRVFRSRHDLPPQRFRLAHRAPAAPA